MPAAANVELTPKQLRVLEQIRSCEQSRACSPTISELAGGVGVGRSTVFEHIAELRRKGLVTNSQGKARCLKLTRKACGLLNRIRRRADPECVNGRPGPEPRGGTSGIPLLGRVAAGVPIDAVETGGEVTLEGMFDNRGGDLFALEVRGESMIGEGICSGDYVICKKSATARDGQLVVAIVEQDFATLKRFYREKRRARLEAANEAFGPIYAEDCRIEAVVTGLVRRI